MPAEPVWYVADESQIRQIVWNLATNGTPRDAEGRDAEAVGRRLQQEPDRPGRDRDRRRGSGRRGSRRGAGRHLSAVPRRRSSAAPASVSSIVHRIVSDYGGEVHVTSAPRRRHARRRHAAARRLPKPMQAPAVLN